MFEEDTEQLLLEILHPAAPADKKGTALQYILEMTGTDEGLTFVGGKDKLLEATLKLLFNDNTGVRDLARKCLTNLTADEKTVGGLIKTLEKPLTEAMRGMLEQCLDPKQTNTPLCCILTNLTRGEEGAAFVASVMLGSSSSSSSVGLKCFVDVLCNLHANKGETLSALSALMMNLTQVPAVRRGLMEGPQRLLLPLLPIITFSQSLAGCKGIVGTVKHCCFEYDFHDWLLGEDVDLLPRLLLPLAGAEEFDDEDNERLPPDLQYLPDDKTREADPQVRGMLIDSIHKLCSTKPGRKLVKDKNTYVILRELHKWESNDENNENLHKVIDILIGDEPKEGMEDLHTVEVPEKLHEQFLEEDKAESK